MAQPGEIPEEEHKVPAMWVPLDALMTTGRGFPGLAPSHHLGFVVCPRRNQLSALNGAEERFQHLAISRLT